MNAITDSAWIAANQRALVAEVARVRGLLETHLARKVAPAPAGQRAGRTRRKAAPEDGSALDFVAAQFGLSSFERDVLVLAAGVELESGFAALCAEAHGDARRAHASFSLALAALPGAHWSALAPDGPLRYWRLLEVADSRSLTSGALAIDERVLHFLAGVGGQDAKLPGLRPIGPGASLPAKQRAFAEQLASAWRTRPSAPPVIVIHGGDAAAVRNAAAHACGALGIQLFSLAGTDIPAEHTALSACARLATRECSLQCAALLVETGETPAAALTRFIDELGCAVLVHGGIGAPLLRPVLRFDMGATDTGEQLELWRAMLPAGNAAEAASLAAVASHYRFGTLEIRDAAAHARAAVESGAAFGDALYKACRERSRGELAQLAQLVEPRAAWDDLVLPPLQLAMLREICMHARHRATVYDAWGFAAKSARGLGLSALFAGESGTGKTLAAEVVAGELHLDLYRIDLSAVVSKYIGETEKNLKRVFDAAENSGAVLLFDEADALFGKRSSVKDSHDRYANIEVAYLLQRMEDYRGVAILTTNMKGLLDYAFLRRIRFVVQFPFPDAPSRARIWQRVLPDALPRDGIDVERLARLNVAGGNIRNIALNAAFHAADAGQPLSRTHVLLAARAEYAKLEKPLSDAEMGGLR